MTPSCFSPSLPPLSLPPPLTPPLSLSLPPLSVYPTLSIYLHSILLSSVSIQLNLRLCDFAVFSLSLFNFLLAIVFDRPLIHLTCHITDFFHLCVFVCIKRALLGTLSAPSSEWISKPRPCGCLIFFFIFFIFSGIGHSCKTLGASVGCGRHLKRRLQDCLLGGHAAVCEFGASR